MLQSLASKSRVIHTLRGRAVLATGFAVLIFALPAFAGGGATPLAPGRTDLKPLEQVATWTSPKIDVAQLLREDEAARAIPGIPLRIGFPMTTDLTTANSGSWENLVDGGQVWRLSVRSEDALWIVLGFETFRLPNGAVMWVYDPGLKHVQGPYTSLDVREHGQLWTPPAEGDSLVIELDWPEKLAGTEPKLQIGTISHGYKPFGSVGRERAIEKGIGDSGSCNIDVNCPLGAAWQDQKRGVVILLSGGSSFCTGSLINTTANDCRPYVLTASHCTAGTSTTFGFNFERPACNSGTPPPETTYSVSGASILGNFASSDFTLLQMSSSPPESFNVYYSGWNRSTAAATETHVIHHPSGDVKKISYDADAPVNGSNWGTNHWRIEQYTDGTTEPGSSGSPLFDQNHRIIGQLHGGTASCTSLTYDEYGKVDASWIGGGTPATRLSDWLDPNATGELFIDGVNGATCAFNPAGVLTLNRDKYACTDTLTITLRDDNLRGNPTQTVTVTSNTESTPETVTLTAIEPGSGTFTGTFPIAAVAAVNGDGRLSVVHGDTVTVLYIDADNGAGGINVPVTTTAAVDCVGPVITNVRSQNLSGNSADILWSTDELSNSRVTYDTAFPPTANTTPNAVVTVSHQVSLTGLTPCTTYYYSVSSTDTAGNITTDTNGGLYYTFRTGTNTNPTYSYPGPAVPIPDNIAAGVTATINVPYFDFITSLTVTVNVTHTFDGDLSLSLIAPDGRVVPLSTRRGSSGDNFTATVFDDAASTAISAGTAPFTGSFRPESPLGVLSGMASYGNWQLKAVDSASSDTGSIVSWSLTLNFPPAPCGASVSLNANTYSCSSAATITVRDTNVAGPTVTVSATSATEPGGEAVTLTRLAAPQDTWFQGTLSLTSATPVANDGNLSMVNADVVTVTYIDADDGQGNVNVAVSDTASTDCASPSISNVASSGVTGNSAVISWNTNESSNSMVHYGLSTPPGQVSTAAALVTSHSLPLSGLTPCSSYYYSVESVDTYGNSVTDNNGGNYYLFTTLQNTDANFAGTDTPLAVPDNNTTGVTSTINVADLDRILDLNVVVNLTHTFDGDVTLTLIAPNGAPIVLSNRRGSSGDNFTNTVFDDDATTPIASGTAPFTGSFKPDNPLNVVNGLAASGAWKLRVTDTASGDVGTLQNWSLQFVYEPRTCGPSAVYNSNTTSDSCSGGGAGSGNGFVERSEDVAIPVTIRNNGTVTLTGISATLSSPTPEVFVTRSTATYPDVASGLTSTSNAPHYAITVGTGVPCGSLISFNLQINSNQGVFNSAFTIRVGSAASATNDFPSTDVPKPIPDDNTTGATSTVTVSNTNVVQDVNVTLNITHTFDGDLTLTLIGPNGASVALSNKRGSSGDNFTNTTFDDSATTAIANGTAPFTGTFRPDSPLTAFNGIAANGNWTLKAVDSASSDVGTITGWTLRLTTANGFACTDCSPLAPVGETLQQVWTSKTTQQWTPVAGGTSYKLYRGDAGSLSDLVTAAVDSCSRLTVPAVSTGAVLTESPAPGGIYWYLVRAANSGGEGPAGSATAGPRIHDSSGACP